jgi:hypothetical protein
MGFQPRIFEKFTDENDLNSVDFPYGDFEYDVSGSLSVPYTSVINKNYGFVYRSKPAVKQPWIARFRCSIYEDTPLLVDAAVDEFTAGVWANGLGKLYTIDSAGVRRWTWAILNSQPQISWKAGDIFRKGISVEFICFDDMLDTDLTTDSVTITASGQSFTITNGGALPRGFVIIQFKANTSAGIINPKLVNNTNGYTFETARDSASANSEIKLDTEAQTVKYSNDNGATYADDIGNLVIPTLHPPLAFPLARGNNSMTYTGGASQSLDIVWSFYAAYPAN